MGFFSGDQIQPVVPPTIWSQLQTDMGQWLLNQFIGGGSVGLLKDLPKYPGETSPDISKTMLPNVWGAWSSDTPAYSYLQDQANATKAQIGQVNPLLAPIINQGYSPGMPGEAMQNSMLNGSPSPDIAQYLKNMATTGSASQQLAQPLYQTLQQGTPGTNYMLPFLMQTAKAYHAPSVPGR